MCGPPPPARSPCPQGERGPLGLAGTPPPPPRDACNGRGPAHTHETKLDATHKNLSSSSPLDTTRNRDLTTRRQRVCLLQPNGARTPGKERLHRGWLLSNSSYEYIGGGGERRKNETMQGKHPNRCLCTPTISLSPSPSPNPVWYSLTPCAPVTLLKRDESRGRGREGQGGLGMTTHRKEGIQEAVRGVQVVDGNGLADGVVVSGHGVEGVQRGPGDVQALGYRRAHLDLQAKRAARTGAGGGVGRVDATQSTSQN